MGNAALAVRQEADIQVGSLGELRQLAEDAAASRFFGATTPEQALVIMMAGRDLGLSYMQSLRMFHVINGKPTMSADGMVGVCKASPLCEKFERVSESATSVTWATKRQGEPEQRSTFTLEDAERAGLLGKKDSNWAKYPIRMLNARAKAFLARDVFPDILAGLLTTEEAADMVQPRHVETVVRHVPEPRPTPAPESGPREAADSAILTAAKELADEMRAAMSLQALAAVGAKAAKAGLPEEIREALKGEYAKAKARCTPPEDTGDSWEPVRG